MKLHNKHKKIIRGGVKSESNFTIKTTAKAFDILSSGLYSDKILAVVRELSCNAYDAHVEADKADVPFEVHIPNMLEPYFSVKDFGVGLSDEQIHGLYTTYFDSTKTESNDFIGALGLGSKSPFSYTSTFEVISRYYGTQTVYSIFINEDGVPTVARMGEVETEESNGLEVKLTVNTSDYYKFENKAQQALKHFPVKPIIVGSSTFKWEDDETDSLMENAGWRMVKGSWGNHGIIAIQGNVGYAVDLELLDLKENEKQLCDKVRLYIKYELGELEVAASREALQYDEETKTNLITRLREVIQEIQDEVQERVASLRSTPWTLYQELNRLSETIFGNRGTLITVLNPATVSDPIVTRYLKDKGTFVWNANDLICHEVARYYIGRQKKASLNLSRDVVAQVAPHDNYVVMINDIKSGGVQRMAQFIRNSHDNQNPKQIICIRRVKNNLVESQFGITDEEAQAEVDLIIESMGSPNVERVSTLPASPKNRTTVDRGGVHLYTLQLGLRKKKTWNRTKVDLDRSGLFFRLATGRRIINTKNKIVNVSSKEEWIAMNNAVNLALDAGIINDDSEMYHKVMGATPTIYKKLEKRDNWFNFFSVIDRLADQNEELLKQHQFIEALTRKHDFFKVVHDADFSDLIVNMEDCYFKRTMQPLIDKQKKIKDNMDTISLITSFGEVKPVDVDNFVNDFADRFPMLSLINTNYLLNQHWGREERVKILNYVGER